MAKQKTFYHYVTSAQRARFQNKIWDYYKKNGRHDLPWRRTRNPYRILISEVMLQQTRSSRVLCFYEKFLKKFPTVTILAKAPLKEVLLIWQGLGYNRRALFLKRAAEYLIKEDKGRVPQTFPQLVKLSGVGINTAGAIMTYAYNKPSIFIETNIRTVFIHEFFKTKKQVNDVEILKLVEKTLDMKNPREWYWALMDYGSYLKNTVGNPNIKSRHYSKQSKFKGSLREARGQVLKLLQKKKFSQKGLEYKSGIKDGRIAMALEGLVREGFIVKEGKYFSLY